MPRMLRSDRGVEILMFIDAHYVLREANEYLIDDDEEGTTSFQRILKKGGARREL